MLKTKEAGIGMQRAGAMLRRITCRHQTLNKQHQPNGRKVRCLDCHKTWFEVKVGRQ